MDELPHIHANFVSPELTLLTMNLFLMKLGGQVQFSLKDLEDISKTYAGSRFAYNPVTESLTATLLLRPEEYPAPELPPKAEGA